MADDPLLSFARELCERDQDADQDEDAERAAFMAVVQQLPLLDQLRVLRLLIQKVYGDRSADD